MIGRCDVCDKRRERRGQDHHTGLRYSAPITAWRCSECGGPLRNKRRGETESVIIDPAPAQEVEDA